MEFLLDTVDLKKIKYYCDKLNVKGVTSNPTILKKDGVGDDLFAHLKKIKEIIGDERELHVQVVAPSVSGMIDEAHKIVDEVGKDVYIKVPTTLDELKEAAKTIYEKSNHEVVGAGFDSLNNYYAIGMKNKGIDFTKELDFASDASKEVVKYYADGIRDGYFRTDGSDKY